MSSILITGATGAFGKAFVNELLCGDTYDRICIYSRGEAKQAQMRDEFDDDDRLRWFIGDVRDKDRLRQALNGIDHVVHAAALKRIETCFYNSEEVTKTNVLGTLNVINNAVENKVKRVVTLSSDKAYNPVSIYGFSKAMAEHITLNANHTYGKTGPIFTAVRYGNILNSTGSVIPKWFDAKNNGRQIYLTDPDCTRFSMYQEEAVKLVIDAIETDQTDKPLIPILPAYRLGDLAEAMEINDYQIIGLPVYEKMHECMDHDNCSQFARRLSIDELKSMIKDIGYE